MQQTSRAIIALFQSLLLFSFGLPVWGRTFVSYAALGDSYATGGGAGSPKVFPHFDVGCGRYDGAYPVLIARQSTLAFRNLACAGSVTTSVLKTQVPWVGDSDIVSVQVGGNEVDFFGLLNECVRQWKPLSTCEDEIARAKGLVQSADFIDNYDNLVKGAMDYFEEGTKFLVLGYARFFNDTTKQCNHVSFSNTDPTNFLTQEMRSMFNQIVVMLNDVIQAIAQAHGAIYVDIDGLFETHRFCEEGVTEPAPDTSWFFNDGVPMSMSPQESHHQHILSDASNGFLNLTRTFHPTIDGHKAIAHEIMSLLHRLQD